MSGKGQGMRLKSRSRRTNLITAYVVAVAILFFGRELASSLHAPASEPVSNALIFISDTDTIDAGRGSNSVYRIGVDGSGMKRLVGSIPYGEGYLRISDIDCDPDSQQLVIASQRHDLNGFHHAMLDGSGLHLDRPAEGDLLTATREIALAPDGVSIIVSRQFEEFREPRFGLVAGDLGSRAYSIIRAPSEAHSYRAPYWSPNGESIVYVIEVHADEARTTYRLAIGAPDGSEERIILETQLAIRDIAWSPAGDRLALVLDRQVFLFDRFRDKLIKLTDHLGGADSPRWSPDGAQISYVSPSSFAGQNQLFVMNADGSGNRRIANVRGDVVNGCWV
ncbi:MAG: hypothetical protein OXG53_07750 [Chloroflexi bacterium]|nr:hypothetical protein [Chloroflexota bacterium]